MSASAAIRSNWQHAMTMLDTLDDPRREGRREVIPRTRRFRLVHRQDPAVISPILRRASAIAITDSMSSEHRDGLLWAIGREQTAVARRWPHDRD